MTLARELSTDEKNPKSKTLSDVDQDGVTVWVGGLPYELAVDKTALHDLLSTHGGDLKAITVRLKPPAEAGGTNKSWCFATFRNEDAIERLQHAAATAEQSELKLSPCLEINPPSSPYEHDEEALTPTHLSANRLATVSALALRTAPDSRPHHMQPLASRSKPHGRHPSKSRRQMSSEHFSPASLRPSSQGG